MSANLVLLVVIGVLVSCGVYLILERSVTKMLLGLVLFGNAVNLLILTVGGADGAPAIVGRESEVSERMSDPLAQAMILTAIVITMGVAAFVLALGYRSFTMTTQDTVEDDPEDLKVASRRSRADAPDRDRSDDPETGAATPLGDAFDAHGNPIPLDQLPSLEDIEGYEELHGGVDRRETAQRGDRIP
ncbi:Na(+)/H(+) antiporter subunit C [Aldersonia kunmingensis]|uniref:Na(+)/H(+) antiporter subunit C n=1 Tax=Aldersonia kunmingensis TaxID=408066 RepID=UPI000831EC19|nr:Na(+)/H(+) antiporter subunit C [Aldersonia kunmingensis]